MPASSPPLEGRSTEIKPESACAEVAVRIAVALVPQVTVTMQPLEVVVHDEPPSPEGALSVSTLRVGQAAGLPMADVMEVKTGLLADVNEQVAPMSEEGEGDDEHAEMRPKSAPPRTTDNGPNDFMSAIPFRVWMA